MITASAPGKILLLGAYGVLDGAPSLVLAHGPRLTLRARPGLPDTVDLSAPDVFPHPGRFDLGDSPGEDHVAGPNGPLRYLGAVFSGSLPLPWSGLRIETESHVPAGLGSSAAVLITAHAARALLERAAAHRNGAPPQGAGAPAATDSGLFRSLLNPSEPTDDELRAVVSAAYRTLLRIQGGGSGADLAAAAAGGAVDYRLDAAGSHNPEPTWKNLAPRVPGGLRISVWRKGGKSTDTAAAVRRWKEGAGRDLLPAIADTAEQGIEAWQADDGMGLAAAMDEAQRLQERLGAVSDADSAWMQQCRSIPGVLALTATGAGGGEAVAVLWDPVDAVTPTDPFFEAGDWFPDIAKVEGEPCAPGLRMHWESQKVESTNPESTIQEPTE